MRIDTTKLIRIVTDNPFIRISQIAVKLGIPFSTVKKRVYTLKRGGKLVLQKRTKHVHVVTSYYARKNNVPDVYVEEESRSNLEQQLWFNDLIRVAL